MYCSGAWEIRLRAPRMLDRWAAFFVAALRCTAPSLKCFIRALRFMLRKRRFRDDGNELSRSRPDHHGGDHGTLCQTQPLTALGLVEQQNRVDESEHAVFIIIIAHRRQTGAAGPWLFGTAVLQRDGDGADVAGWLHGR